MPCEKRANRFAKEEMGMTEQELPVRSKQEVSREEPTRPGRTYQPDVDIYETP